MFDFIMYGENAMIAMGGAFGVSSYMKCVLGRSTSDAIMTGLYTAGLGMICLCSIDTLVELVRVLTQ